MAVNHTNLEDYADPEFYDLENSDFEPDGPFYLALAQQVGGPILELGCGTGRVTIPLARQGFDVTGLDLVFGMLAQARRKAGELPIRWVQADVRNFRLERQFRLICSTGRVFQHLLERADQEAMLARVRQHLAPDGVFQVDTLFPQPGSIEDAGEEQEWYAYADGQGREVRVSGTDHYDPIRQVKHETAYRRWVGEGGKVITKRARLALRYVYPQEMEALLHYNGFTVLQRYGDWDFGPLTGESRIMIYVCRI